MFSNGAHRHQRIIRILVLIVFVTAVFLFIGAQRLPANIFRIGAVAIGTIAMVTAITGFLIAAVQYQEVENPA
jgi:hypothetical protein